MPVPFQEGYRTLSDGTPCYIHPSSALFNRNPVLSHERTCAEKENVSFCFTDLRASYQRPTPSERGQSLVVI